MLKSFHVNGTENVCETVQCCSFENSRWENRTAISVCSHYAVTILLHTFWGGLFRSVCKRYTVTEAENNKVSTNVSRLLQSSFKINLQAPSCTHQNCGSAPDAARDHPPAHMSLHSTAGLSSPPAAFLGAEESIMTMATFRPPTGT